MFTPAQETGTNYNTRYGYDPNNDMLLNVTFRNGSTDIIRNDYTYTSDDSIDTIKHGGFIA